MDRSPTEVRTDLINEWQIEEVRKGLAEADRGEFASDKEVRKVLDKWRKRLKA